MTTGRARILGRMVALIGALLYPLLPTGSLAEPADTTVTRSIIVKSQVARRPLDSPTGFATRVAADPNRVSDLASLLTKLSGVRIKQYGGLGSYATVSVRGSSASQVNVLWDGIPLNDPYGGGANLALIPTTGVRHIDLYRGNASPRWGAGAIGGVVNLVSQPPGKTDGRRVRGAAAQSFGSHGFNQQSGSLWSRFGVLSTFTHLGRSQTDGDFRFLDDNGTPHNSADDETSVRRNNASEMFHVIAKARLDSHGGTLDASHLFIDRTEGIAGIGNHQSTSASVDTQRRLTYARVLPPGLWASRIITEANGFLGETVEHFVDHDGDISPYPSEHENTITSHGGSARVELFLSPAPVSVAGDFAGRKERFHPEEREPQNSIGPDRLRHTTELGATVSWFPWDERLLLTASQRWARHESEFYDDPPLPWLPPTPQGKVGTETRSPSIGFRAVVFSWMAVKGNVGKYHRLPTFMELFGQRGSVTGNASVQPERGVNRDVGLEVNWRRLGWLRDTKAEASIAETEAEDLILFLPNSQYTVKPTNLSAATIRTFEASAHTWVGSRYRLELGYTRMDSEDTSDIPYYRGNQLPTRPDHEILTGFGVAVSDFELGYEFHFIGRNFTDRANLNEISARHIHGASLSWRVRGTGVLWTVEARNLSDNQISDVSGFPLPGRSFYTTLRYSP